jgi:hypothetical protein
MSYRPPQRRARRMSAALVVLTAIVVAPISAQATPQVVAEIDTSSWNRPSPDPSGITYLPGPDRFLVVDSEVDETPHWRRANAWLIGRDGAVQRTLNLTRLTSEPADVDVFARSVLISDDTEDEVLFVRRGRDRRLGTRDDIVRRISTHVWGSTDPEGLVRTRRFLFVADGSESRRPAIYRINAGRDRRFGTSDDRVLEIDARGLGLADPEGITYARRSLYIVSRLGRNRGIVRTSLRGDLLETFDVAGSGLRRSAGIAVVRGTDGSVEAWVTDRGVDNDTDPNENDGKIFVFALAGPDA